jgi:hypothetical protein
MSTFALLFTAGNALAGLGWLGLVVLPGRPLVVDRLVGLGIPAVLGLAYAGLIAVYFADAEGGFSSIEAVRALFASDALLVAGWLHYLAFDLFVGAWEVRTARAEGIPHLLVVPCLVLTFLFGPVGFLAFLALRVAAGRRPAPALEA